MVIKKRNMDKIIRVAPIQKANEKLYFKRACKTCEEIFRPSSRFSLICDDCKEKQKKEFREGIRFCVVCSKRFFVFRKPRRQGKRQVGKRPGNCITCSKICSRLWGDKLRRNYRKEIIK